MNPTLLLDLDDTLLSNDINVFLPEYMSAFARFVSDMVDPQAFVQAMVRGTRAMTVNRQPDCTLQEAFEASFFTDLQVDPEAFYQLANRFYEEAFPDLRRLTQPVPGAVEMITTAIERGYRLAVTTNPLFPRPAVLQRMEWAGLPAEHYPFEVIGSFEKFHYAKPDPAYYAEALAYLGWPEGPVVVVGDDPVRDVAAGDGLGLPTYWIAPGEGSLPDGSPQPSARGGLDGLMGWLDTASTQALTPDLKRTSALLAILRSTPAALDSLYRDLPAAQWKFRPKPGEWSLTEIACHLRDVESEVNLPRVRMLLETGNPFLAGQDTDPWAEERDYIHQDGRLALGNFIRRRMELVAALEALTPESWQLRARHAIFGPTRLIELVSIMTAHDRLHVQQVRAVLQGGAD